MQIIVLISSGFGPEKDKFLWLDIQRVDNPTETNSKRWKIRRNMHSCWLCICCCCRWRAFGFYSSFRLVSKVLWFLKHTSLRIPSLCLFDICVYWVYWFYSRKLRTEFELNDSKEKKKLNAKRRAQNVVSVRSWLCDRWVVFLARTLLSALSPSDVTKFTLIW